jgi:Nitroreductase
MELSAVITARRSIRKFKPDLVAEHLVTELLEAARLAPSGSNLQPTRFIVIKTKEAREKLKYCTPLQFVHEAPVVMVCLADTHALDARGQRMIELKEAGAFVGTPLESADIGEIAKSRNTMSEAEATAYLRLNAAIAIEHIVLRATDLGLGSCWVMMFDREQARKAFEIDKRYIVVALLPIGYPDQNPGQRPRISAKEILIKDL